jgi:uncharacterized repeat protein (TIGR01451 family)
MDFGFVQPASIAGKVWLDANRNGAMDEGERGVSGVVVSLFDASNASGAWAFQSISTSPIVTANSNAGGEYTLGQIMPGRPYSLHFALPAGFGWGRSDGSAMDANGSTGVFTATSGAHVILKIDAGATQPTRLTIRKTTAQTMIGPDERMTYTIVIRNAGETLAAQTLISDPLPSELQFISAAPWPSMPPADGAPLVWAVGDLPAGQTFSVTLVTQLKREVALAGSSIMNTAYLLADMQTVAHTNDLQSSAISVLQPSAITLASFGAAMESNGVLLTWRTSLEQNTFGFFVLRSATGNRADALRVNAGIIAAGAGNYTLLDTNGSLNNTYWLQELELDGTTRDAGPFRVTAPALDALAASVSMQPAINPQPEPAVMLVSSSNPPLYLAVDPPAPALAMETPSAIAPVAASNTSGTPALPAHDEPSASRAEATAITSETNSPAMETAVTTNMLMQPVRATTTPESHGVEVGGLAQAVSVQRGNPTPRAAAMQSTSLPDTGLPIQTMLLLGGTGMTGVLLLAMAFAIWSGRRRQRRNKKS